MTQSDDTKSTKHEYLHNTIQPQIGRIVQSDNPAIILVQYGDLDPKQAKLTASINRSEVIGSHNAGREVLLLFENGDPEKPIIIDLMQNPIEEIIDMEAFSQDQSEKKSIETVVDDKGIILEAKKQITLKCGKGSITIKEDGKIVVRGTNLISRSSGMNRIKGGSVDIN